MVQLTITSGVELFRKACIVAYELRHTFFGAVSRDSSCACTLDINTEHRMDNRSRNLLIVANIR